MHDCELITFLMLVCFSAALCERLSENTNLSTDQTLSTSKAEKKVYLCRPTKCLRLTRPPVPRVKWLRWKKGTHGTYHIAGRNDSISSHCSITIAAMIKRILGAFLNDIENQSYVYSSVGPPFSYLFPLIRKLHNRRSDCILWHC